MSMPNSNKGHSWLEKKVELPEPPTLHKKVYHTVGRGLLSSSMTFYSPPEDKELDSYPSHEGCEQF